MRKPSAIDRNTGFLFGQAPVVSMPVQTPHQRRLTHGPQWPITINNKPMSWGGNRTECGNDIRQFRIGDWCAYPATTFPEWMRATTGTGPPRSRSLGASVKRGITGHLRPPSLSKVLPVATIRHRHRQRTRVTNARDRPFIASTSNAARFLRPALDFRQGLRATLCQHKGTS